MATKTKPEEMRKQAEMADAIYKANKSLSEIEKTLITLSKTASASDKKELYLETAKQIAELRHILCSGPLTPDLQTKEEKAPEMGPSSAPSSST